MVVGSEPGRETRGDEQQALEEIRRLFERYRQTARHGIVTERYEPVDARTEESDEAPDRPGR